MDGWMNGQVLRYTDVQVGEWIDRCTGRQMQTHRQVDGWVDGYTDAWVDGQMDRQLHTWVDGCVDRERDNWIHRCMSYKSVDFGPFFMAIVFMLEHHLVYSTLFEASQEAQW